MSGVERSRGTHLHSEDYPETLRLLAALFAARTHDPVGLAEIGYEPTQHGAWVDWESLAHSWLSSTETAVMHIARGCAVLEHHGGPPPRLIEPLRRAIASVTAQPDLPRWAR